MIKLFGHPMSTCTRKVLTTLAETNTPHEFVMVDFAKGEHKQPAHLARQPFGQLPALDDDGFALYESRAMCRYLNEKTGGKLMPADVKGRALAEQWISIEAANFTPHAMKFIYHHVFQMPQEASVLNAARASLELCLGIMETHLTKHAYLAGGEFSLADVSFMPYVEYGMATPLKETFSKFPHVSTWWNRVSERASWRKATAKA